MSAIQAQRVVIFGREGLAREQLVAALTDLGVEPIWVGKPVQSDPEKLSEMNPSQIIISLEPLIESELMPYSDFLSQSDISVLYDDAESTRHLSGWDLNRWARHMASKLLNQDYMPPAPVSELNANQEVHGVESDDAISYLPSLESHSLAVQLLDSNPTIKEIAESKALENQTFDWQSEENYDALDINPSELKAALDLLNQNLSNSSDQAAIREMNFDQLIPLTDSELLEFQSQPVSLPTSSNQDYDFDFQLANAETSEPQNFDVIKETNAVDEEPYVYMDEAAIKLAEKNLEAQLANSGVMALMDSTLELQTANSVNDEPVSAAVEAAKPREFDLSKFSLIDDETIDVPGSSGNKQEPAETIQLQEHSPVTERTLFLVLSGQGGPGIVRSIATKIKNNFSGTMVLAQSMDAGQLPKFLAQLQKVVGVPVIMPISEEYLKNGNVYLLPENHTIQLTALGYQCVSYGNMSEFIAQVDHNVEIIVLSGSDATLAQSLIQVGTIMANIHVQTPEECFDATLPQLLVNMGVPVIRQEVLDMWFN